MTCTVNLVLLTILRLYLLFHCTHNLLNARNVIFESALEKHKRHQHLHLMTVHSAVTQIQISTLYSVHIYIFTWVLILGPTLTFKRILPHCLFIWLTLKSKGTDKWFQTTQEQQLDIVQDVQISGVYLLATNNCSNVHGDILGTF